MYFDNLYDSFRVGVLLDRYEPNFILNLNLSDDRVLQRDDG
jgi:hypothetical protein